MASAYGFLPFRKLPTFGPAPVANGISTIEIPIGPTYYAIALNYKVNGVNCTEAQAKADIKFVRLKVNGVTRMECSGKHLVDVINKYYGISWVDGQIFVPLARPWYRTPEAMENTAWGTRNLNSLTLEVEFGSPIVSPTMTADALFSYASRDLGMIVEVHEFTHAISGAGQAEYTSLPKGNGDLVALHADGAIITQLDLDINQQTVINGNTAASQSITRWMGERSPQTNYVHVEGQLRNLLSEGVPLIGVSDFRVKPTTSGAGTIYYVMETLNTPLGSANPAAA